MIVKKYLKTKKYLFKRCDSNEVCYLEKCILRREHRCDIEMFCKSHWSGNFGYTVTKEYVIQEE